MFDELNDMKIDHSRNVGITNPMKSYTTFSNEIVYSLYNAGFIDSDIAKNLMIDDGYFNFCVPLSILGFYEDYKCVVINARLN